MLQCFGRIRNVILTNALTGQRKPSIFVKKINYWTISIIGTVVYGSWLDVDLNRTRSNCLTIMKHNRSTNQYIYHTRGVCPPEIHFKIDDGKIKDLRFVGGGCPGNAQLVSGGSADSSQGAQATQTININ